MPVVKRAGAFQVSVHRADALEGYRRIRRQHHGTERTARELERTINEAIDVYGWWAEDMKGATPKACRKANSKGTLRISAEYALRSRWNGTPYAKPAEYQLWELVEFMEARGKADLDDIQTDDVEAYIASQLDGYRQLELPFSESEGGANG